MIAQINVRRILGLLVVVSLILGWIAVAPVAGAELVPLLQETATPTQTPTATPTEPPAEPEATEPPAEATPEEPLAEPTPPAEGGSGTLGILVILGIVGVAGAAIIAIIVVLLTRPDKGPEGAAAEVSFAPITSVAEDIKEGRVSKIQVSGKNLTITRTDGVTLQSHKEPTADLVQLLANLGVTAEMMSKIVIDVETPEQSHS